MKLRRINARRFCDDETGTYYEFGSDMTESKAIEQIEIHLRIFRSKYPDLEWYGKDHALPTLSKGFRKPKDGSAQ